MHIEKKNKGSQYLLLGILNLQNGIKQIKTISILKLPINIGGTFSLKINFCAGYALPNKKLINRRSR